MTVPHTSQSITNHPIRWLLGLQIVHQNRTESKSRFFVENRIEIDRLAKISYRHSTNGYLTPKKYSIARAHRVYWSSCTLSIFIVIVIIPGQCLWCCHHAVAALWEFALVHAVSAARRQVAADLWTKPIGLNHKPASRLPANYTHHRHFIITQPESWYSFYHPTEVRRLSWPSWLATYRDGLPTRTWPPIQVLFGSGVE